MAVKRFYKLKYVLQLLIVSMFLAFSFTAVSARGAQAPQASAGEAVLEVASGRVLYGRQEDKILPMASTTKILTAIIIIEDCNLQDVVKVTQKSVGVEGSSIYLVAGETLTVQDLLYGLMLRSGNDCAETLALYHSGSIEAFAKVMNERAAQIGAQHSHFCNPHGLPQEGHETTALDLAKIAAYALRNDTFKKIVSASTYTIADGGCGYVRVLKNKNKMLAFFQGADGVKTGYTKAAGRCLVTSATRNGMQIVSVVLNSPDMYERSAYLLEDAFSNYTMQVLFRGSEYKKRIWTDIKGKTVCACGKRDFSYPLQSGEAEKIRIEEDIPIKICLPVQAGQEIGCVNIYLENQLLFSEKIVSIEEVKKSYIDILRKILQRDK